MEPVAFTFRNSRLTAKLMTPCGVGAAQLASEPFDRHDIINLGDFALTHKNNQTVFSFQIPSTHEYDFVKQIEQGVGAKKIKKKR